MSLEDENARLKEEVEELQEQVGQKVYSGGVVCKLAFAVERENRLLMFIE